MTVTRRRQVQPALPAIMPGCPHCGSAATRLELPLADDGNIEADRHRCDVCAGHFWQLTIGTGPRRTVR